MSIAITEILKLKDNARIAEMLKLKHCRRPMISVALIPIEGTLYGGSLFFSTFQVDDEVVVHIEQLNSALGAEKFLRCHAGILSRWLSEVMHERRFHTYSIRNGITKTKDMHLHQLPVWLLRVFCEQFNLIADPLAA